VLDHGELILEEVAALRAAPPKNQLPLRAPLALVELVNSGLGFPDLLESQIREIFPGHGVVFADWFTGHIIIPRGELVEWHNRGYADTYEEYLILDIVRGRLEAREKLTLSEFRTFRDEQFRAYQQTSEYKAAFNDLRTAEVSPMKARAELYRAHRQEYLTRLFGTERSLRSE
jgi:hypothetical protein